MRNMKKLRRVRLAAGALGEILVYSTLALFAELCFIYHSQLQGKGIFLKKHLFLFHIMYE